MDSLYGKFSKGTDTLDDTSEILRAIHLKREKAICEQYLSFLEKGHTADELILIEGPSEWTHELVDSNIMRAHYTFSVRLDIKENGPDETN